MTGARLLADGLAFPEGPVELPDGSVAVVQMAADLVTVVAPDGSRRDLPCGPGPNGMALAPGGQEVVVCLNGGLGFERQTDGRLHPGLATDPSARGGLALLDLTTGAVRPLVPCGPGSPVSAPNDVVVAPEGTLSAGGCWFTDLGRRFARHQEHGGISWCGWDGKVVAAAYPRHGRPNGIGLSHDGRTLYVSESQSAQLWAWDVLGPGRLGAPTLLHQFAHPCRLDGLAVLPDGDLVVATLVVGRLTVLSPRGQELGRVELDDPFPTNVCLVGRELQDLVVTLGSSGRLVTMASPSRGRQGLSVLGG